MFQALSVCSVRAAMAMLPRWHIPAEHALVTLAGVAAIALASTHVNRMDEAPTLSPGSQRIATLVAAPGASLAGLDAAGEDLRARLLTLPGVGAVSLHGVQTAGLEVQYAPARLAHLGVRVADLQQAVPAQAGGASPGRLELRTDLAGDGPAPIANLPVIAGSRVFRLGDLAAVARVPLPTPLSTLTRDGRPALDLLVTPAPGAAGRQLGQEVTESLATWQVPAKVALK